MEGGDVVFTMRVEIIDYTIDLLDEPIFRNYAKEIDVYQCT
jgi:hypothetical protein